MSETLRIDTTTITTRRRARRVVENAAADEKDVIDLGNLEFISRSVAAELVHRADEHGLRLRNAEEPVSSVIEAVDETALA